MKMVKWGAGLIAVYLVVRNYTGAGKFISSSTSGASTVIKAFQGR